MATLEEQIFALEDVVNGAAKQVTIDGVTVAYDIAAAQRRLGRLKRQLATSTRRATRQIDLSNF